MGHPSLAAAVSGALGPGWQVDAVYDLHVHELDAMTPKIPPGVD